MTTPEVTDCHATRVEDDERGAVRAIGWMLSVDDGNGIVIVHVQREGRGWAVVGWKLGESDYRAPLRPADTLDEDVANAVDEYMHRGRR